ncbi:hypothetical protein [Novosphingobium acidiphilum]|uniref:hypothetical protein n=1 Tax=Novosphingobium acidiphilum TaxID=505248 RepID=UPI0012EBC5A5|nr:hypothetical protein [Novosphingobium acidiphilum]
MFKADAAQGSSEGNKARPVLVIAAGEGRVVVMAVTTKGEFSTSATVKIPEDVARAMGLPRPNESWLLAAEANDFTWVGYDLRLVPGKQTSVFGRSPPGFVAAAIERFRSLKGARVNRD